MTSYTQSHTQGEDTATDTMKNASVPCDLCPSLQALEEFAKKKYASYRGLAERNDNKQKVYDPLATNFLQASQLLVQAVLRSTQKELERAA